MILNIFVIAGGEPAFHPLLNLFSTVEQRISGPPLWKEDQNYTHVVSGMIFRNLKDKRGRLGRDALARLPAKVVPPVLRSNLAKQASEFGLVSASLATLFLA